MIQPGTDTNYPTSSGSMRGAPITSSPIASFNGFTLTVGMIIAVFAFMLIYSMFFAKRRRR